LLDSKRLVHDWSMVTKDAILDEIRRLTAENDGSPIGQRRFSDETGIREHDWLGRYWRQWSDALVEAGFEPNAFNVAKLTDDQLVMRVAQLTLELGHYPTRADVGLWRQTHPDMPLHKTISARIGGRREVLRRLLALSDSDASFAELQEICGPLVENVDGTPTGREVGSGGLGFVYLIRMDKWHKIGCSSDILRRTGEIRITLPVRETLVHTVETDDPFGVERYWHQRFADRRTNGEWFDLTTEDVRAFKKWRRIS